MSNLEKRGDAWSYRFMDEHGRRVRRTFDTHAEAKAAMNTDLARVDAARTAPLEPKPIASMTFGEVADKYLARVELGSDIRSKKDPRSIVNAHLRVFFGSLCLDRITPARIDDFREQQLRKLEPRTVDHHLMTLSGVLKFAREHEYTTAKPIIRRPKCRKRTKKDLSVIPAEKIPAFLQAAERIGGQIGLRSGDPKRGQFMRLLYFTALSTGLRKGELACLTFDDLDFDAGLIHVERSYNGPPKNGDPRAVPMTLALGLIDQLREWKKQAVKTFVFPNPRGGRLSPSSRIFNETFRRVCDVLELDGSVTFHSCRHSFATMYMEQEGASLWRLKDYLGHGSIALTEIYAHRDRNAAKKDAGILSSPPRLRVVG